MKKSWILGFVGVLTAVFAGAFLAVQLDRAMNNKPPTLTLDGKRDAFDGAIPVSTEGAVATPGDFRLAAKKLAPSVVSVDNYMSSYFSFDDSRLERAATGSGVIISSKGYVVTNNHVVEGAQAVRVRLGDGRSFQAKVVGTDPRSDVAVLKIEATNLTPAQLGDNSRLEVGEWVIAIGNPLGYDNTVSVGVVSNLNRTLSTNGSSLLVDAIQTDAAINQGNSGGALANASGQIVGINTAIISNTGGSIGLGFAIPINTVKRVADEIVTNGRVRYGEVGVRLFNQAGLLESDEFRSFINERIGSMPPKQSYGLAIRSVFRNSAATKAGIQPGDILLEMDGKKLVEPLDYVKGLFGKRIGDQVSLKYWSRGSTKTVTITLSE
ncbi:MAG: trypsin-like peptidase domain-containing protein [Fimbriimonadaceae bacterium]|nr:trypsin-like peptidase domain-containing protein [Fimbriimonadaceae bacterium]